MEKKVISIIKECITESFFACKELQEAGIKIIDVEYCRFKGAGSSFVRGENIYRVNIGLKKQYAIFDLCEDSIRNFSISDFMLPPNNYPKPIINVSKNEWYGENDFKKDIEGISIFSNDIMSKSDVIYKYAVSCTLFHEIGHLIKDREDMSQIEKEQTADDFSFDAMISCANTANYESSPVIIGALMSLFGILKVNSPEEIADDKDHPHILDRIGTFMGKLNLKEDSSLWLLCLNILEEWLIDNNVHLDNAYPKDGTSMDKFNQLCSEVKSYTNKL